MRVAQKGLGRNTSAEGAGATEPVFPFDDRCFQAKLTGANGGNVAARSRANHSNIEGRRVGHECLLNQN
jgi:hypothetical protein